MFLFTKTQIIAPITTKVTKKAKTPASALTKTLRNNLRTHEDYISKVAIKTIKGGV